MHKVFLLAFFLFFSLGACATDTSSGDHLKAVESKYPTGMITKSELRAHEKFFNHHETEASASDIELLKSIEKPIIITTYFGLWCHDSKREVPQLLDLLDAANNKNIVHRLIALDIKKTEPFGRQEEDEVFYTPTIVVKVGEKEIGRIVERPNESLAKDIISFINN